MAINGRQDLIDFTLRSLGSPIIQINVTAEMLEDRLDDTIALWQEYSMEGNNRDYIRKQVTEEDIHREYFEIPYDEVLGITRLIPVTRTMMGQVALPFDPYFMMLQNTMNMMQGGWASIDLQSYTMFRQYGETIELLLRPKPNIRFNRFQEKLFVDWTWSHRDWRSGGMLTEDNQLVLSESDTAGDDVKEQILFDLEQSNTGRGSYRGIGSAPDIYPGDFIILECHKILHPEEFPRIYNSTWIKRYYKEKVRMQWGTVLRKFGGMTLPGGVQLNGDAMVQEAEQELEKLFNALLTDYSEPMQFFIG